VQVVENGPVTINNNNALSEDDVRRFFDVGWIEKKALFRLDEIRKMRECFDNLERLASELTETSLSHGSHFVLGKNGSEQVIKRVVWAGGSQPYLLKIGADRRLTVPSSQLLSSDTMEQLLSQAHFKRPNDGVVFGWHQDIQHRDKGNDTWRDLNGTGSFVQSLLAIDEMTADSGPLMFMPGSSAWGRADFGNHDYDQIADETSQPAAFREADAVTVLTEPGDVLFFGPYTAHASFENTSNSYRRVLINGYAYPGANSRRYPGEGAGRLLSIKDI